MRHHHPIAAPPHQGPTYDERWGDLGSGLLCSWLRGIEKSREDPELAVKCRRGELPVLVWKGGTDRPLKSKAIKVGSLHYLATWMGLRGDDLDLDDSTEPRRTCTRTGVTFQYTTNVQLLLQADEEAP